MPSFSETGLLIVKIRSKGEPVNISRGMETLGTPHHAAGPGAAAAALGFSPGSLSAAAAAAAASVAANKNNRLEQRSQVRT